MAALLCRGCMNLGRITTKVTHLKPPNVRLLFSVRCPGQLFKGIKSNNGTIQVTNKIVFIPNRAASREALFRPTQKLARLQASDGVPPKYTLIYRTDVASYFIGGQFVVMAFLCTITALIVSKFIKVEENEEKPALITSEASKPSEGESVRLPPRLADFWENDDEDVVAYMILAMTLMMAFTASRLFRQFPLRIYASSSGHCYGIYYSALIPAKKVRKEFVAGTLKAAGKSKIFKNQLYRDGSGGLMFLLEDNFRTPMDYNELLDTEGDQSVNSKS